MELQVQTIEIRPPPLALQYHPPVAEQMAGVPDQLHCREQKQGSTSTPSKYSRRPTISVSGLAFDRSRLCGRHSDTPNQEGMLAIATACHSSSRLLLHPPQECQGAFANHYESDHRASAFRHLASCTGEQGMKHKCTLCFVSINELSIGPVQYGISL